MTQEQLKHTMFPLGAINKIETRKIAAENGFVNSAKPDSQDICFVPKGDYASVIEKYSNLKSESGEFVNKNGEKIGTHKGIINYTIGQRKGLGISAPEPLYVCDICARENKVVLGSNKDLFDDTLFVKDFNWISGVCPKEAVKCKVKIRYRQKEQDVILYPLEKGTVKIKFDNPQRAITSGQAAVAYDGDIVLGGGVIIKKGEDYVI